MATARKDVFVEVTCYDVWNTVTPTVVPKGRAAEQGSASGIDEAAVTTNKCDSVDSGEGSDPYDLTEWKKFISSSITNDAGQVPRTVRFGRTVLKDRFHPTAHELESLRGRGYLATACTSRLCSCIRL